MSPKYRLMVSLIWTMELTVHDEDVHEEIASDSSCESSDTNAFDSQIVDKLCDELELIHSSSPTPGF